MEHPYSVLSGDTSPNGKTAKAWKEFDHIISQFLVEQKVPGASLAISNKGIILYQQGYGIAGGGRRVHEDSMFRIASISKPITAAIVMKLCDKLQVSLNTNVFGKTGILKSYKTKDKRMKKITIRHLLQHSSGWDRDKVGDAVFVRPQCVMKEHPDSPAYNSALVAYALRRKLQFSPGTWHSYSNLGYLILGEVVEALSGQPYHCVMEEFLRDLDINNVIIGRRKRALWASKEVEYFNNREPQVTASIYPGEGDVLPQYGGMAMKSSGSYGGLVADTASLLKFLHCMNESFIQCDTVDGGLQSNNAQWKTDCNNADQLNERSEVVERSDCIHQSTCCCKTNVDERNDDLCGNEVAKMTRRECSSRCTDNVNTRRMNSKEFMAEIVTEIDQSDYVNQSDYVTQSDCVYHFDSINPSDSTDQSEIHVCFKGNHKVKSFTAQVSSLLCDKCAISKLKCKLQNNTSDIDNENNIADYVGCNWCRKSNSVPVLHVELPENQDRSLGNNCNSRDILFQQPSLTSEICHNNVEYDSCNLQTTGGKHVFSKHCHIGNFRNEECVQASNAICSRNEDSLQVPIPGCNMNEDSLQVSIPGCNINEDYLQVSIPGCNINEDYLQVFNPDCNINDFLQVSNSYCNIIEDFVQVSNPVCNINEEYLQASNPVCDTLVKPLMTCSQSRESLSRPEYENGCDWYGLGWDVQDNGKSWGHTGGMEGSCGTLFHHHSGLNWAFLLNSWTVDSDLNGVIKCALSTVSQVKMYNQDVLNFDSDFGVRVVTCDQSQVICLYASESAILRTFSDRKTNGYFITWISCMSQNISCVVKGLQVNRSKYDLQEKIAHPDMDDRKYLVIFQKCHVNEYSIVFNKTVAELNLCIHEYKKEKYVISVLDSFVDTQSQLKFTAVFKYDDSCGDTVVLLAMKAADYVKYVKSYIGSYNVTVQSVTEMSGDLYVSAVLTSRMTNPTSADIKDKNNQTYQEVENDKDVLPNGSYKNVEIKTENVLPNGISKFDEIDRDVIVSDNSLLNVQLDTMKINYRNFTETGSLEQLKDERCKESLNTLLESVKDTNYGHSLKRTIRKSAVLPKKRRKSNFITSSKLDCIYWVQISPESFLTELNRQIQRKNNLVYAKFYTSDSKPYVSGCWLPHRGGNCYHRTAMSKYGLVPELVEAASKNIHLQCLSEYMDEDGTIYYAAIWLT